MPKPNDAQTKSYLLRLWRDSAHSPWHATLQKVRSREVIHFDRPEQMWTFLQEEMAGSTRPDKRAGTSL